ncbi:MAG: hypothetical protein RBU37_02755 [Myxococcota bacterium]|jgi:hypothetical protein|nr:hypothetical protein [Myxococcota bacterium]
MCLALYLFTDAVLEASSWNVERRGMYLEPANESKDRGALAWPREGRQLYYLGSATGCGCGWQPVTEWDDEDERLHKLQDRASLAALLEEQQGKRAFLVACWEGDQGKDWEQRGTITPEQVLDPSFEFEELGQYLVGA